MIKQDIIEQLRELDLCEAIGRIYLHSSYKIKGNKAEGLSPFKTEKTPSFFVNGLKRVWKCFGSGESGKDIIDFVMKYKKISFVEAVTYCCDIFNIAVEYEKDSPQQKEQRVKTKTATQVLEYAKEYYKKTLANLSPAKKYLFDRGFSEEIISLFELGYSIPGLITALKENAVTELAEELGLLSKDAHSGMFYERFRNRLIFPIHNKFGVCVGFGGRIIEDNSAKTAKYINSSQSFFFNKSALLFGLHLALKKMAETQEVYLVEGYTDVMRMHQIGITNCVATLGTSLSELHIQEIKKVCKKVIIFRDSDAAGISASWRDLDLILQSGLLAEIVVPETDAKLDPDDIGKRENAVDFIFSSRKDAIFYKIEYGLNLLLNKRNNGNLLPEDIIELRGITREILSNISDVELRNLYQMELKKKYDFLSVESKKSLVSQNEDMDNTYQDYDVTLYFHFPEEVENPQIYTRDILNYSIFQHNNKIYALSNKTTSFIAISNFSIDIIQHMQDEDFPMKLIRLRNVFGKEHIFDVLSDKLNTLNGFKNVITGFGNFFFDGNTKQLDLLLKYLFDRMGSGRKIDILGWQPEGFWVWNNKIIVPNKGTYELSKEGVFEYQNECYYIPSANKIYDKNSFKYGPQKKFKSIPCQISLAEYFYQMYIVHKTHAITGILFGIASFFQDIVVRELTGFPVLFYFGPASTGKDQLSMAVQSLFGIPQSSISLGNGASTTKAQLREFTQFSNGLSLLSEYRKGDFKIDEILKGLWDRRGYKRGSKESKIATDEIPILSSSILTSNEYPDDEALISRLIWDEMSKNEFTQQEQSEYNKLSDIIKKGVSGLSDFFIYNRGLIENVFYQHFRSNKKLLSQYSAFDNVPSRILSNLAVLLSFFDIFDSASIFPFSRMDVISKILEIASKQKVKLISDTPINKFWDCFLTNMKFSVDGICIGHNIREDGGHLMFNFTAIYGIIQKQWFFQYRDAAPSKTVMKKMLKDSAAFVEDGKQVRICSHSIDNTNSTNPTSAIVFDLNKIDGGDDILSEIKIQLVKSGRNINL